jgi:hypothetical protein
MLNRHVNNVRVAFVSVIALSCAAGAAFAQPGAGDERGAVPVVRGAPMSGDGVVTVKSRLYDGTRTEQSVSAKYYRDSDGRVRRDQTILGLDALNPAAAPPSIVTIVDPVAQAIYMLMPETREAQRIPFDPRMLANTPYPSPQQPGVTQEEPLGTRTIDGIAATGRRTRLTIPPGKIGNDRPIEITDERWESPDLKVLLLSRYHDPRTGDVEYRLTNISRAEPAPDLFTVPADYRVLEWSTTGPRIKE